MLLILFLLICFFRFVVLEFERPLPDLISHPILSGRYKIHHSPQFFFALVSGHIVEFRHVHLAIKEVVHKRFVPPDNRELPMMGSSVFYVSNPCRLISLPCNSAIVIGYQEVIRVQVVLSGYDINDQAQIFVNRVMAWGQG